MTKSIALFGAGGKMGLRLSENLMGSAFRILTRLLRRVTQSPRKFLNPSPLLSSECRANGLTRTRTVGDGLRHPSGCNA